MPTTAGMNRRTFLGTATTLGLGATLFGLWGCDAQARQVGQHPWMYITAEKMGTLRSVDEVRIAIREGHARMLWVQILSAAREDLEVDPLTPGSVLPGRSPLAIENYNADFVICEAAGRRVLRGALVHLLTEEPGYKEMALQQMASLFDPEQWPMWLDKAHLSFGHRAGLRTGMLAHDVGLAYDWLYPSLTEAERQAIVDGLDQAGIQPYLESLAQDPWWVHDLHNWMTTIVGGLAIAGMALGDAHPQAQYLVDYAQPLMAEYLKIYGPEGEYNESVAYANATVRPVSYYGAQRYASGGVAQRVAEAPFPQTGRWLMYFTLPPGRVAAFGDARPDMAPWVKHIAAIAAASRDGVLQAFYLQHATPRADPVELLWYDASLAPVEPQGHLPLGRAYQGHGGCVSSRTSWDAKSTPCVVYGKASREENHEHNDDGQVCIDGYGERLIVDLGAPSPYPKGFFEEDRWRYYNASVRGHNVLMFGGREMRTLYRERGQPIDPAWKQMQGRFVTSEFDDTRGGFWQIDLTPAYKGVQSVRRTVVHLLPGIVAVLDEAQLDQAEPISLRWHTIDRSEPDATGRFRVVGEQVTLAAQVVRLDGGTISFRRGEHRYEPPYNVGRLDEPLAQRNESYVEAGVTSNACRLLSLFAVYGPEETASLWQAEGDAWQIETETGVASVQVTASTLRLENPAVGSWMVELD